MTGGLGRTVGVGVAALTGLVALVAGAAAGATGGILGANVANLTAGRAPGVIPIRYLALYQQAATTCPGLPWTVLAAIGTVESGNGTSNLPGVHSGANSAGAEGPMQFEPATFARYADPVPPGGANPPSPYDPADAVYGPPATSARTAAAAALTSQPLSTPIMPTPWLCRPGAENPSGCWGSGSVRSA